VALIFVNAFLDDVERRVERRSRKKSIFGGPLGAFLGQLSDVLIIFGALLFLALKDTYYNFGRFWLLDLSYVEPALIGHLGIGFAAFAGILLLRYMAGQKKDKGTGLWTRSERMYLFGGFAAFGLFSGFFSGFLFTGTIALVALIYLSVLKRVVKIKSPRLSAKTTYKTRRTVRKGFFLGTNLVRSALKVALRVIGVLLLGIYLALEKVYLALERGTSAVINALRNIQMRRKAPMMKVSTPMEETEELEEVKEYAPEPPEPETITFPPPPEGDSSYIGEEDVGESMLVEYEPPTKKEDVVIDIVDFMISEGKDVVVVSTQPATSHYKERFNGIRGIKVINLPDQAPMPEKDEIPMTNLEYFSEVFEELSKHHVFVFEPLSSLILHIGISQAYRFISQTLNRLSNLGVTFIVFMNKVGHDKKDISNFENLFINIAEIEEGKLKKVR
ncbi:MAG: hypothetical protein ACE5HH_03295, partial [Candidatus Hydrothermarchaeales archaeon]